MKNEISILSPPSSKIIVFLHTMDHYDLVRKLMTLTEDTFCIFDLFWEYAKVLGRVL